MKNFLLIVTMVLFASIASAQVLTTAETIGAGKQMVAVTENSLSDSGTGINIVYAMYAKGLTSRFDLYTAIGQTRLAGEAQMWAAIGSNGKLLSAGKISVSLFTFASTPLQRFNEASLVLLNTAVVMSRPVNSKLSLYTGVNILVPIGKRNHGFFTPVDSRTNLPLGASLTLGNWGVTAEADLGKLMAVGVAISKTF